MFSSEEFQTWAKGGHAVLFASVMTKIDGRPEDDLLRTYGFRGFPSLAVLAPDGEMVTNSVQRATASMAAACESAQGFLALKAKHAAGEVDAAEWYLARLRLGMFDLEAARKNREGVSFDKDQAAEVANRIFELEIVDLQAKARATRDADPDLAAAPIYEGYKSGLRIREGAPVQGFYAEMVLHAAKKHDDAEAFVDVMPIVCKNMEAMIANMESRMHSLEEALAKGDMKEEMKPRYEDAIKRTAGLIETQQQELADLVKLGSEMKAKIK